MDSDAAGITAIAAAALAVLALLLCALVAARMRRIRSTQQLITGEGGERTLAEHAAELDQRVAELGRELGQSLARLQERDELLDRRLQGAISRCSVIRYDAMGEMTGRQSSTIALLDAEGTGVLLSSILLRDQARLYVKPVMAGRSEFDLSPEESEALQTALRDRG